MSTKKFKCTSCGKTSEKIGVCSIARQTLNVASEDYTNLEIDETIHGFCLDCATIIPNAKFKKLTGLTARKVSPNYQRILTNLVNSAETEGCDGCATVSLEALNKAPQSSGVQSPVNSYTPVVPTKVDLACNGIRAMFFSKHYSKVVPDTDIQVMLNNPHWQKIYGRKTLHEAWNKLVSEGYVNKKHDVWFWGIEYSKEGK